MIDPQLFEMLQRQHVETREYVKSQVDALKELVEPRLHLVDKHEVIVQRAYGAVKVFVVLGSIIGLLAGIAHAVR